MEYKSTFEILTVIGSRLKEHRLQMGLTQKEVSERSGISVPVIRSLESGEAKNISFSSLVSILRVYRLEHGIDGIVPECPPDPYVMSKMEGKTRQRVRHSKNESL